MGFCNKVVKFRLLSYLLSELALKSTFNGGQKEVSGSWAGQL